jgi:hypothetical protein
MTIRDVFEAAEQMRRFQADVERMAREMPIADAALRAHVESQQAYLSTSDAIRNLQATAAIAKAVLDVDQLDNAITRAAETLGPVHVAADLGLADASVASGLQAAVAAFENSSLLKAAAAFNNSDIARFVRSWNESALFTAVNTFANSPLLKAVDAFKANALVQLSGAIKSSSLVTLANGFEASFPGLRQFATSPQFQAIVDEALVSDSFIERVLATMATIEPDIDDDDDELAAGMETAFVERVAVLPRSALSHEGMIQLVVAILFLWYQMHESAKSEQRIMERIGQMEQNLTTAIGRVMEQVDEHLTPLPDQVEHIRVVVEPLKIRVSPDRNAHEIALLEPGQRVKVVARAESWIEVEYFDSKSASMKKGWVAELYTKEVTKE